MEELLYRALHIYFGLMLFKLAGIISRINFDPLPNFGEN